nr:hypothetical protein [Marinomonas algarum]
MTVAAQQNPPDVTGKWQLQNADQTQATLEVAVNKVAKEMNFFIRALAKPVLREQTQICDQWQLDWQKAQFQWQCDDTETEVVPMIAQGEKIKTDDEGVDIFATYQHTADSVVVILTSERGKRTNTWQRLNDQRLLYTAKLESEKLPTPLTWSLNYRRVP